MILGITCAKCGEKLDEQGALLFGPPWQKYGGNTVTKYHICIACYPHLIEWVDRDKLVEPKRRK